MHTLLTELNQKFNPSPASAIISKDSLVIVSAPPEQLDEDLVARISAALFSVGSNGSQTLTGGSLGQLPHEIQQTILKIKVFF